MVDFFSVFLVYVTLVAVTFLLGWCALWVSPCVCWLLFVASLACIFPALADFAERTSCCSCKEPLRVRPSFPSLFFCHSRDRGESLVVWQIEQKKQRQTVWCSWHGEACRADGPRPSEATQNSIWVNPRLGRPSTFFRVAVLVLEVSFKTSTAIGFMVHICREHVGQQLAEQEVMFFTALSRGACAQCGWACPLQVLQ